jgi:hypothetical protein
MLALRMRKGVLLSVSMTLEAGSLVHVLLYQPNRPCVLAAATAAAKFSGGVV